MLLLPYLGRDDLYAAYRFDEPWDGPNSRALADRMPRTFAFHGAAGPGNTTANSLAVVGEETVWRASKPVTDKDVPDRTSSSILVVENDGAGVHWMEPRDLAFADMDLRLGSPAGVSSPFQVPGVAMLDTRIDSLRPGLTPATLRALLTIAGGERLVEGDARGWEVLGDGRDRPRRER